MKEKILFLGRLFLPLLLGGIVGFLISSSMNYSQLNQPPLAPKSIVFPIVWTLLYLLMGISYVKIAKGTQPPFDLQVIYYTQLFVNLLWPIFFFVFKWYLFSSFWILLLLFLVYTMIKKFRKEDVVAASLQIPYFLWTLFATYLTIGIAILN